MNLDALFDDLLTSGVTLADPHKIQKLRVLNTFHLFAMMSAPLLGLFYYYIGAITLFYAAVVAGLLMLSSLLLLRKTGDITLIGNFSISILWALIFLVSWNTGGITYEGVPNPSWVFRGCLILLAVFLMGYLHGTIWTLVAFCEIGLLVYLYRTRFQFPNVIPIDTAAIYHLATLLLGFLGIVIIAFLFQSDKEEAFAGEQLKTQVLRESKKQLDEILERSPVPTFVIDQKHRVVQWNSACQNLTGLSAMEVLGKDVWEGFSTGNGRSIADMILDDPAAIEEQFPDKIVSKSESGWFDIKLTLPNLGGGMEAVVNAAPLFDEHGTVRGAIQTVRESAASPDADLIRQGGALVSFSEVSFLPVFKVNGLGKISFWNSACEEQFGYTSTQMIGADAVKLVAKGYRPLFQETIGKALEGAVSTLKTWRYEHVEKKRLYVIAKAYPVVSKKDKGNECAVVNTVVTELVMRLRQAEKDAAEAREKLKSVSEEHELLKKNIAAFIRGKDESRRG